MTMESKPLSIPRNGLVAEYLLDGNALDTNDGTKNNGTATNVTYANTSVGFQKQAGVFNGSSSGITIGGIPASINDNDFSISFSARFNSVSSGRVFYFQDRDSSVELSSGTIRLVLYDGNINNVSYGVSTGVDYHFSFIRNRSTGLSLYVNGELKASSNFTGVASFQAGGTTIGRHKSYNLEYLNGSLQSVRLYNRALTSKEIQTLYLESKRMIGNSGNPDLFKDCVAYYDFKGDANAVIGGNNGTVNGATLTTDALGMANSAYLFTRANSDYISCASSSGITGNKISIEFSIKAVTYASPYRYVCEDTTAGTRGWEVAGGGSTGTNARIFFSVNGTENLQSSTDLTADTWYHVLCTFDGATKKIYVNGQLDGSQAYGGNLNAAVNALQFGRNVNATSYSFLDGKIGFVRLFNQPKTADEAKALYEASISQKQYPFTKRLTGSLTQGLRAYIDGSVSGTTAYDQSGNGNNGTLVGSPTVTRGGLGGSVGIQLNGSQGINLGNSQVFSGSAYSISTTYVPLSLPSAGTYDFISSKWGVESSATAGHYFGVNNNGGTIRFTLTHFAGGSFTELFWNYPLSVGKKYRITLKWNGSQSELFINGTSLGAQSNSMGCSNSTNNHTIGISSDLSSHGAHGIFANTMINGTAVVNEAVSNDYFATYLQ